MAKKWPSTFLSNRLSNSRSRTPLHVSLVIANPPLSVEPAPSIGSVSVMASNEPQIRQKRLLPSRSRRGGPGVGGCDIDVLILDTQKRKGENEPLIPAETRFLLTTHSALVASSSSSKLELNHYANERYFDRPEVLKAFREQQIIETPEFIKLSEDASVGSRFRPRSQEDPSTDTSDTLYEKRHRKYELLEKRQRLREKEQLKHEQYKLKERIDQLRSMDAAAFLALPPSPFSSTSSRTNEQKAHDEASATSPEVYVNGSPMINEGERRRREMLDVASGLEERYRTLLLPKGSEKDKKNSRQSSVVTSVGPEPSFLGGRRYADDDDRESEVEPDNPAVETPPEKERLKLRIKVPPRLSSARLSLSSPRRSRSRSISHVTDDEDDQTRESISPIRQRKRRKVDVDDSVGGSRVYFSDSLISPIARKHVSYTSAEGKTKWTTSALLIAALRRSSEPNARKTQRHVTAFGYKVPPELEQIRDFSCPAWLNLPKVVTDGTSNRVFTETGPPAHIAGILGGLAVDATGFSQNPQSVRSMKHLDGVS